MKIQLFIWSLLFIINHTVTFGQRQQNKKSELIKIEAQEAFLRLQKTLLNKNCNELINSFNDSIIFIYVPKDTVFSTWQVLDSQKICAKIFRQINPNLSIEEYLNHYKILTFNKSEFSKYIHPDSIKSKGFNDYQFDTKLALGLLASKANRFDKNDIFIIGYEPLNKKEFYDISPKGDYVKKERQSFEIWQQTTYMYMLRKTKNGWKIKAIST